MDIIKLVYELTDEIKKSSDYQELLVLKRQIDDNLKDKIKAFKEAKEKYESVYSYKEYCKEFDLICKTLSETKRDLYSEELVINYLEKEAQIQKLLDDISNEIKLAFSSYYKKTISL